MKARKKNISYLFAALLAFFFCDRAAALYESADGDFGVKLLAAGNVLSNILRRPFYLSSLPNAILFGMFGVLVVLLCYTYFVLGAHKLLPGKEHGSAEWGAPEDIARLMDKDPAKNMILTETESLSMSSRMPFTKDDDFNRNKHVLVVGGSGSGKSRNVMKPNMLQMNCNYVVTDPKGALLEECGYALATNGYKIKILDLVHMDHSDHYNLFAYMHTEDDIVKVAKNIITNLKADPRQKTSSDPIWEEGMTGILEALLAYVLFELQPADRNMNSVMELFRLTQVKESVPDYVSPLDVLFDDLKKSKPDAFAVKQYEIYKMAAPKTAESINVSLGLRLSSFNIPSVSRLVQDDTLHLEDFAGESKVALFIITPDTTKAYNFLAAVLYQQMFDILVYAADSTSAHRLPRHCRLMMDEFANIGQIPDFECLISTLRSREISVTIVLQSMAQLKSMYHDDWQTIVDNCDSLLFLGGSKAVENLEYFSKILGKQTIEVMNTSENKGSQGSFTKSYQSLGRELMTPDEIQRMPRRFCLLMVTGLKPFYSRKYDLTKHPNYHLLKDANKANAFDFNRRDLLATSAFMSDISTVSTASCAELNNL
jgi:type IV secretion system protein VirD4